MSTVLKTEPNGQQGDSNDSLPKKIVIRRLPPTMTKEQFLEIVSPLPEYDFMYFSSADLSLGPYAFCRAYIYFKHFDDVLNFRDRFDNYVFVDQKSNEYPAIVEFAPFPRKCKNAEAQKKDTKCNTLDQDGDYLAFLKMFDKPASEPLPTCEAILEEIEQREKEKMANGGGAGSDPAFFVPKVMTPLLEYLKKKREDKKMSRNQEDSKKRRDDDRKQNRPRRDRDHHYGSQSSKDGKNYGSQQQPSQSAGQRSSKNIVESSNIKILTKPQQQQPQPQQSQTPKPVSNPSNTQTSKTNESKPSTGNKPSVQNYNNKDSFGRDYPKSSQNKSHTPRGEKNNANIAGGSKFNKTEFDKKSQQFSNEKNQMRQEVKQSSVMSSEEKKTSAFAEAEFKRSESDEAKEGKGVKNKDRPSIEIYNPAQRAALRQQRQPKSS